MENIFSSFNIWIIIGIILIILEFMAPGVFLVWLGVAALVTGILGLIFPMNLMAYLLVFSALSLASVLVGRKIYAHSNDMEDETENLNERIESYMGQTYIVEEDIIHGRGRVRVDDSSWLAFADEDIPKGTEVRIIASEGTALKVEPVSH